MTNCVNAMFANKLTYVLKLYSSALGFFRCSADGEDWVINVYLDPGLAGVQDRLREPPDECRQSAV